MTQFIVRRETIHSQTVDAASQAEAEDVAAAADEDAWEHQDTSYDAEEAPDV